MYYISCHNFCISCHYFVSYGCIVYSTNVSCQMVTEFLYFLYFKEILYLACHEHRVERSLCWLHLVICRLISIGRDSLWKIVGCLHIHYKGLPMKWKAVNPQVNGQTRRMERGGVVWPKQTHISQSGAESA